jgi:hypothetical protein
MSNDDKTCRSPSFASHVVGHLMAVFLSFALLAKVEAAPPPQESDWPCVQRFVPTLSVGSVWQGPPIDSVADAGLNNAEISALVDEVTAPDTPMDQAEQAIASFAGSASTRKNEQLTALFAGVYESIAEQRAKVIQGIKNYARGQRALGDRIASDNSQVQQKRDAGVPESDEQFQELTQRLTWEIRIFEDRERLLTTVCEHPRRLEQRLFAVARAVMSHLE